MVSLTTSLTSSGIFSRPVFFASARTRRITSLARLPSSIIHSTERRAAFRSGSSAVEPAQTGLGIGTTAASGWFTSWAIEAVSSPSVVTRGNVSKCRVRFAVSPLALSQVLLGLFALGQIEHEATPWSRVRREPPRRQGRARGCRCSASTPSRYALQLPVALSSATARSSASCHSGGVSLVQRRRPETDIVAAMSHYVEKSLVGLNNATIKVKKLRSR